MSKKAIQVRTQVKSGGLTTNHGLRVRSALKAGHRLDPYKN